MATASGRAAATCLGAWTPNLVPTDQRGSSVTTLDFTLLIWLGSLLAGFLGSLTGLGGGVVIIPFLVLGFGVDLRYAIGASLVSVIATSSGAAAAYVKEGYTNVRLAMFLELATTGGALAGVFGNGRLRVCPGRRLWRCLVTFGIFIGTIPI